MVSFLSPGNSAVTHGGITTVTGIGFGSGADPTATAAVSGADCLTANWASVTSATCALSNHATSGRRFDGVTVVSLSSTRVAGFTFDGELPDHVKHACPIYGLICCASIVFVFSLAGPMVISLSSFNKPGSISYTGLNVSRPDLNCSFLRGEARFAVSLSSRLLDAWPLIP